jgi:hypothetical protein
MDVYKYIAENPKSQQKAINLCYDYGMQPQNDMHLADCLCDIVSNEGEQGLKEVMKLHPDRDIIVNYYKVPISEDSQRVANMLTYKYVTGDMADKGTTPPNNTNIITDNTQLQTNIIIFAAAVLIGFAIISKN